MSQFVSRLVLVASLVAVLGASSIASANPINSVANRRQHPRGGFFKHTTTHHTVAQPMLWRLFR